MNRTDIIFRLHALADPEKVTTKAQKFGIVAHNALGIYLADLKILAQGNRSGTRRATHLQSTAPHHNSPTHHFWAKCPRSRPHPSRTGCGEFTILTSWYAFELFLCSSSD
ncbi:MAG: hypothetical protein AAGN35_22370 [Bacteroidota bacterium]